MLQKNFLTSQMLKLWIKISWGACCWLKLIVRYRYDTHDRVLIFPSDMTRQHQVQLFWRQHLKIFFLERESIHAALMAISTHKYLTCGARKEGKKVTIHYLLLRTIMISFCKRFLSPFFWPLSCTLTSTLWKAIQQIVSETAAIDQISRRNILRVFMTFAFRPLPICWKQTQCLSPPPLGYLSIYLSVYHVVLSRNTYLYKTPPPSFR